MLQQIPVVTLRGWDTEYGQDAGCTKVEEFVATNDCYYCFEGNRCFTHNKMRDL